MKSSKIICRVTDKQRKKLEEDAISMGVSISEIIRLRLELDNGYSCNERENGKLLCEILTEIQNIKILHPEINIEHIEEGMEKLWQELM